MKIMTNRQNSFFYEIAKFKKTVQHQVPRDDDLSIVDSLNIKLKYISKKGDGNIDVLLETRD